MKRCTGRTVFNRRCLGLQSIVAREETLDETIRKAVSRLFGPETLSRKRNLYLALKNRVTDVNTKIEFASCNCIMDDNSRALSD